MFESAVGRYREMRTDDLIYVDESLRALERGVRIQRLAVLKALEERKVYEYDGCRNMESWLAARDMVHVGTARAEMETARALASLPKIAELAATAQLSADQLRHLAVVVRPDNEDLWAETAPIQPPGRLAAMAAEHKCVEPQDGKDVYTGRHVRTRHDRLKGASWLTAYGPSDEIAMLNRAIEAKRDQTETEAGEPIGFPARNFDALMALGRQELTDEQPLKPLVVLHAEADALTLEGQGWAELARSGIPLCSEVARRLSCDCSWQLVAEGPGGPIGIGRRSRSVPAWLESMVWKRDGGCRFPGCRTRYGVQAHHIVHWADDGPADLDNLVLLCWLHHHLVHEGGWTIRGSPAPLDDLAFHRRDGRRFASAAAPLSDDIYDRFLGVA